MGYDLHVTRAEHWFESEEDPISADEWLAVIADDPELRIDARNGPYFAVWSGFCSHSGGAWFNWSSGQISSKFPDRAILGKMLQLASHLGAKVQGDEGELYSNQNDLPSEEEEQAALRCLCRPWWKFW
jgi:hypothetical protein